MPRVICEGVQLRVDDVWAGEDNGKTYYLSLLSPENVINLYDVYGCPILQ